MKGPRKCFSFFGYWCKLFLVGNSKWGCFFLGPIVLKSSRKNSGNLGNLDAIQDNTHQMAGLSKIGGEPFIKPPGMKLLSLKCTVFHYVRVSKRKVRWEMGYDFRSDCFRQKKQKRQGSGDQFCQSHG